MSASHNIIKFPTPPSPPLSPRDLADLEATYPPATRRDSIELDPLLLRSKVTSDESISELRKRGGKSKKIGGYYEAQNEHIESLLKSLDQHAEEAKEDEAAHRLPIKIAIYGSLAANVILAGLQLYAAAASLSLSFFATASDSVFDPAANLVLNWCHRKGKKADRHLYPSGGSRFETIGDITYSFAMGMVSIILICFSIQDLATHKDGEALNEFHLVPLIAVSIAFVTKFLLFLYCFSIRGKDSQVGVLWEDHRNDLFVNGLGIITNACGAKIAWWIDPTGALVISVGLVIVWTRTAVSHFYRLAGRSAPIEFQKLVVYKAMTFSDAIEKIDSCVAYSSGPNYFVEVDIVMAPETPLWQAHEVGQALQDKLETLAQVDRAFVHIDVDGYHKPEHRKYE